MWSVSMSSDCVSLTIIIPKLPNNILDLHNSLKENTKSNRDEKFLLVNDYENNKLVFSTITNLKFLSQVDTIFLMYIITKR